MVHLNLLLYTTMIKINIRFEDTNITLFLLLLNVIQFFFGKFLQKIHIISIDITVFDFICLISWRVL